MRRAATGFLILLGSTLWAADDAKPAPRPRLKIEPEQEQSAPDTTQSWMSEAKSAEVSTPTMMDRFVVKDQGLVFLLRRQAEAAKDPKGKFNWKDGGRFYRKDKGAFRFEVGIWAHIDPMAEDARFKGGSGYTGTDFLRVKW